MNGAFKNATAISIAGNNRLCGSSPELQLPKCSIKEEKNGEKMSLALIIVIPIICMLVGLAFASYRVFIRHKRRSKTESTCLVLGQPFSKYSYEMLLKATNQFSSDNMIGMGSFSRVFKGVLEEDGAKVAVKVLNLDLRGASKSFMAECEAWRNIRHRNRVKIITACSSVDFQGNDFKALVYKFMPNGSLESWLHPASSPGGDSCHTCDLKPSNILLDEDMVAHVADFGLAKFLLR